MFNKLILSSLLLAVSACSDEAANNSYTLPTSEKISTKNITTSSNGFNASAFTIGDVRTEYGVEGTVTTKHMSWDNGHYKSLQKALIESNNTSKDEKIESLTGILLPPLKNFLSGLKLEVLVQDIL